MREGGREGGREGTGMKWKGNEKEGKKGGLSTESSPIFWEEEEIEKSGALSMEVLPTTVELQNTYGMCQKFVDTTLKKC